MLDTLRTEIQKAADPVKAKFLAGFFKTGKGQYGENDVFLGITVPQSRKIAVKYKELPLSDVKQLLASRYHEERLIALLILVYNFSHFAKVIDSEVSPQAFDLTQALSKVERAQTRRASRDTGQSKMKEIFDFYLAHTKYINNWDLVDLSADKIVGEYLFEVSKVSKVSKVPKVSKAVLYELARSDDLWERRIAMIATYAFIKRGEYEETFAIADILLHDSHDLIQKAVGWMLREVGKRVSEEKEEEFLRTRYKTMPRTALRYAIERFHEEKRKKYLTGEI